jgi:hypothetical protein
MFPYESGESTDFDKDGLGDNADPDDDNDSYADSDELACGSNPLDTASVCDTFTRPGGFNSDGCIDRSDYNERY